MIIKAKNNEKALTTPGWNNDQKNVFNTLGNKYIGSSGSNLTFQRDPEKLLKQYSNLIHKMGKRFGNIKMTYAERQDLYAYISEVFFDLVREFDMSNGMDFPGYIAKMLPTRIRGSYLDSIQDYKEHISPLKDPTHSIEELADFRYGQSEYTFSYSRKSPYKREKRRDGKVRGIVSQAVNRPMINEMDNSLAEIHTAFKAQGYTDKHLHELVDLIALKGLTTDEAKKVLAHKYKLSKIQINTYYTQLVNLMKQYANS